MHLARRLARRGAASVLQQLVVLQVAGRAIGAHLVDVAQLDVGRGDAGRVRTAAIVAVSAARRRTAQS